MCAAHTVCKYDTRYQLWALQRRHGIAKVHTLAIDLFKSFQFQLFFERLAHKHNIKHYLFAMTDIYFVQIFFRSSSLYCVKAVSSCVEMIAQPERHSTPIPNRKEWNG